MKTLKANIRMLTIVLISAVVAFLEFSFLLESICRNARA